MTDYVNFLSETQSLAKRGHKRKIGNPFFLNRNKVFQVFFLMNDEEQSVCMIEIPEIDLEEVISSLRQGDSVFIKYKKPDILP